MSIYRLNIDSGTLQQSGQVAFPSGPQGDPSQHGAAPDATASDQVLLSGDVGSAYQDLQLRNERQNAIAGAIHKTDRAAELLGQKIDALKAPLETIVKNFPPFSPEDKERIKLLMNYSSIRKEIDQLILPPPPEVIEARKAVTLAPPLSTTSDDSQIADHLSKLDAASADLKELREKLAAGTASFLRDDASLAGISGGNGVEKESPGAPLTESTALQLSAEVGRQFAISVRQGVTFDEHPQFLKGLS